MWPPCPLVALPCLAVILTALCSTAEDLMLNDGKAEQNCCLNSKIEMGIINLKSEQTILLEGLLFFLLESLKYLQRKTWSAVLGVSLVLMKPAVCKELKMELVRGDLGSKAVLWIISYPGGPLPLELRLAVFLNPKWGITCSKAALNCCTLVLFQTYGWAPRFSAEVGFSWKQLQ